MNSKAWMVAGAMLAAGSAQATCYSVYNGSGTLILESSTTPVNLTLPIGDSVPQKFGPGAFMTVSALTVYCKDYRIEASGQQTVAMAVSKGAPMKLKAPNSREAKELEAQLQALEAEGKPQEPVEAKPEAAGEGEGKPEAAVEGKTETESQQEGGSPAGEKVAAE